MILEVPPRGVVGGWMGVGGDERVHPTHVHMHTHACTYDIIGNPWDYPKSNRGGHLHEITMFTTHACACVHVHACACMCTCVGGTPSHPHPHPATPPSPRAAGSRKHQNSITLELIEIIRFCLKILYL